METVTVRKRLEDACTQLDKSIAVLRSEQPAARADFPQDEIDAGTSLAEGDRAEAILASAMSQRSEIMAALCLAEDLTDLRTRLGRMVVALKADGAPVLADELKVTGAMAALLRDAIQPNLVQTMEGTPALVHGDFRFDNFLIDPRGSDFMLLDPRGVGLGGESAGDYLEDLARLRTSTLGLADLVRASRMQLRIDDTRVSCECARVAPVELWSKLAERFALIGVQGVVRMAMAGFDMAAWDALAIAAGVPLATLVGSEPKRIPAYNSCGLGLMAPERLADEAERLLAGDFRAVKSVLNGCSSPLGSLSSPPA